VITCVKFCCAKQSLNIEESTSPINIFTWFHRFPHTYTMEVRKKKCYFGRKVFSLSGTEKWNIPALSYWYTKIVWLLSLIGLVTCGWWFHNSYTYNYKAGHFGRKVIMKTFHIPRLHAYHGMKIHAYYSLFTLNRTLTRS
jgi:hypothetical protein